ncbi:MAG: shikimate kinase [Muribaculaceae bacterium]|nr:shikimate kinase [Muribaculaceae bacterium]MDE6299148.1 shikimate kinase [Muribaculaceae bacterium]
MKPLFIIGYMGSGKTTFGKALASATGLTFIDLDFYIEQRFHATVSEIFAEHGEEGFRKIERDMLREVADFEDVIISCGGGTPCFFDNMDFMNSHGHTLWLQASRESLFSRLIRKREKRPLLAGHTDEEIREIIDNQLKAREPHYSKAAHTWKSDSLEDRRQIDDNIADFISSNNFISF